MRQITYSAILVALERLLLLVSATEASLVNQLGKFLFHHLLNFGDSLVETLLGRACHMQVQRRILYEDVREVAGSR